MKYNKEQPIYLQLMEDIKTNIINGSYSIGERLPSIREYSKSMMVNPNTTQRAFRELELEGFIESKTGIGYYVNEDEEDLNKLKKQYLNQEVDNFIEKMTQLNYSNNEIIEIIKEKL